MITKVPNPPLDDSPASAMARFDHHLAVFDRCGYAYDTEAATTARAWFVRYAEGDKDPPDQEAVLAFLLTTGQSLDWIFQGDLGVLVVNSALLAGVQRLETRNAA